MLEVKLITITIDLVSQDDLELEDRSINSDSFKTNLPDTPQLNSIVEQLLGQMATAGKKGILRVHSSIPIMDTSHLAAVAAAAFGLPYSLEGKI